MDVRRATFAAAVRLAVALSTIAAAVAVGLEAVGGVPPAVLVLMVMTVGFSTSWWRTSRIAQTRRGGRGHRIAVVPLRSPLA